jgi:hypothetical protein
MFPSGRVNCGCRRAGRGVCVPLLVQITKNRWSGCLDRFEVTGAKDEAYPMVVPVRGT